MSVDIQDVLYIGKPVKGVQLLEGKSREVATWCKGSYSTVTDVETEKVLREWVILDGTDREAFVGDWVIRLGDNFAVVADDDIAIEYEEAYDDEEEDEDEEYSE